VSISTRAATMKNSRKTLVTKSCKSLIKTETHELEIMKMLNKKPPGLHAKAIGVAAGLFLLALLMPGAASATTAANAVITNTATVNYDDAGGNAQALITATVDVTVNLVRVIPTLAPLPADASTPSGVALDYAYTITSNSNGLDTYTLTTGTSLVGGNITVNPIVFPDAGGGVIGSIDLGATSAAAIAAIGANTITVPNDGAADASLNGLVATDTVIIGGNPYVVSAITDTGAGTETLTLTTNLTTNVAIGDLIAEQGTFIVRTTPTTTVSGETFTITLTVTDTAANTVTDDTVTTVTLITLTVTKYVQNMTAGVVPAGPPASVTLTTGLGGPATTYYVSGVTGNPGDILEYVVGIANAAGSGTAANVIISDPIPAFTTQAGNVALGYGPTIGPIVFGATASAAANSNDFAELVAGIMYIYAGDGAVVGEGDDVNDVGGQLPASTTTYGAFRVTIDN